MISNYQQSPKSSAKDPITSGSQLFTIDFNVTYSAGNSDVILVSIPGFLVNDSSAISVSSNVVKHVDTLFNESPTSSKGEWVITLDRLSSSIQSGEVDIRFNLPKFSLGMDINSDLTITDSNFKEYIRETIYVKTPNAIKASGVQNSVLSNRLTSGTQWQLGKNTLTTYGEDFIYSSTMSIGLIYGGDSSQNSSAISLSGPLIDADNVGYESEDVIVEDILPEGIELAAPTSYGIPSSEITETGFAIQITKLNLNDQGNYIDGSTTWGTSKIGLMEVTNPEPEKGQVYIGKNEDGRNYFKANLGTIPNDEKWTFRYHQKLVGLPTTSVDYPEYVNECFVSTKSMRTAGKKAVHAGTWQTLQEEKTPSFYSAELQVDKDLAQKGERVDYTITLQNFGKNPIAGRVLIPIKVNEIPSDIELSDAGMEARLEENYLVIDITQFPINSKRTVSYAIETQNLNYGYQMEQSFLVQTISETGGVYLGNTVNTEILGEVEVCYVDEEDNLLSDPEILYGKVGSIYQTTEKEIEDYELIEQPVNAQGIFLETRGEVTYRYRRSVANITIQYIDQDGEKIIDSKSFKKNYGENYEYFPDELVGYQFLFAENESGIVEQPDITIRFHYQGLLYFQEVPEIISFGTHTLSKNTDIFFAEKFKHHLVVQDNRSVENSWSIALKMIEEFTGLSGNQIKDSLYYLEEDKELLISDELNVIHSEESSNHDPIDLSETWDEAHGLEMKVSAGTALAEEYSATMIWLLRDVPA